MNGTNVVFFNFLTCIQQQFGDETSQNVGNLRQSNSESPTTDATNVKQHYSQVDEVVKLSTKYLLDYKKESDSLRQELTLMKQRILNQNEETQNILSPQIDSSLKDISQAISAQKDENAKLQSQITELKKETSQVQSLIITCVQKLTMMENIVGNYS